jgi:hypothetical protein
MTYVEQGLMRMNAENSPCSNDRDYSDQQGAPHHWLSYIRGMKLNGATEWLHEVHPNPELCKLDELGPALAAV